MKAAVIGAIAAALLAGGIGPVAAQSSSPSTTPPKSTSSDRMGRHSMEGEITKVDKDGWVHVKTSEGTMIMHLPPTEAQSLNKGDRVQVQLALKDTGPAAKK